MKSRLKQEDDAIIKNFLQRTFFNAWKPENKGKEKYANYAKLELQVSGACDLKCKYCYYAKYKNDLYPPKIAKHSIVLNNLDVMLNWLAKNKYEPEIEIFSGEVFAQNVGYQVVERVIDWQNEHNIKKCIVVPTNMSFIFDDEKVERVEKLIEKSNGLLSLSASVDGKYCDANRPFANGKLFRDDAYYDKLFAFVKKHRYAFHPMIYSEEIEHWKDNWLWYQENMKKYDIPYYSIYLLEVRNAEWNAKQIKEFYKFIRFVVNWTYNHVKNDVDPDQVPKFIHDNKLFNLFSMFSTIGRGVGCSMQSTLQLRLGDLTTSICHRASYKSQNLWKFVVENNEIVDVEALNHNMLIACNSMDFRSSPFCNYCLIREMCNGQCLGSMFETNGDPFIPIPTVCALEHAKVAGMLDELKALDLFHHFYDWSIPKQKTMKAYDKLFHKGEF